MLPPYARQVVNARERGEHPRIIAVGIGPEWFRFKTADHPFVFVPLDGLAAGRFDWWWCAGVQVNIIAHGDCTLEWLQLGMEIAQHTAPVMVDNGVEFRPEELSRIMWQIATSEFMAHGRGLVFEEVNAPWPHFWSWPLETAYQERLRRWERAREVAA